MNKTKLMIIMSLILSSTTTLPLKIDAKCSESSEGKLETLICDLSDSHSETLTFYDSDGLSTTITVSATSLSGEKKISLSNIMYSMSYKIRISGAVPKITSAYDGTYSFSFPVTVTSTTLSLDSSYQATYTIYYKQGFTSTNRWLRVNINSGSLVVTHN